MNRPEIPEDDRPDYDADPTTEYRVRLPSGAAFWITDRELVAEYRDAGARIGPARTGVDV